MASFTVLHRELRKLTLANGRRSSRPVLLPVPLPGVVRIASGLPLVHSAYVSG